MLLFTIYPSLRFNEYRLLWHNLKVVDSHNLPWIATRDFNEIISSIEKLIVHLQSHSYMREFHDCDQELPSPTLGVSLVLSKKELTIQTSLSPYIEFRKSPCGGSLRFLTNLLACLQIEFNGVLKEEEILWVLKSWVN
ncbi:hypothetical protein CXB51_009537 [Gossypium anomalum]|uniref:Uncharacterized protein n=1 Tax=Gossypium anomalum TaxID=47600 RepID=A0A8J5ZBW0_9ROSI|nr:hypothetical protein CXB51_009537 [Gossypium anomalum]